MEYIERQIKPEIENTLRRGKSVLLLGARQTGKTTIVNRLAFDLSISFIQPLVRQRYERDFSLLTKEIELLHEKLNRLPLVLIDEVQKIPETMDIIQDLIDRKIAQFILTGSSARKLKRQARVNLLPGRTINYQLYPLTLKEMHTKRLNVETLIMYGALPEIILTEGDHEKEELLTSYVSTYLEEEVRAEAIVRNLGAFSRFLELAASESGNIAHFRNLSREIGVSHTTISDYYQVLEDCLIVHRVEPYTKTKTRRKLTKAQKYLFIDLGIRRIAAKEGVRLPDKYKGHLFEQFIGLELIRSAAYIKKRCEIYFWQSLSGQEVDWVIDLDGELIPVEVKWTEAPRVAHAKHLKLFINEYDNCQKGYIVCRTPAPLKLTDTIYAISWEHLDQVMQGYIFA